MHATAYEDAPGSTIHAGDDVHQGTRAKDGTKNDQATGHPAIGQTLEPFSYGHKTGTGYEIST